MKYRVTWAADLPDGHFTGLNYIMAGDRREAIRLVRERVQQSLRGVKHWAATSACHVRRERPEFPTYEDSQGREHAEF